MHRLGLSSATILLFLCILTTASIISAAYVSDDIPQNYSDDQAADGAVAVVANATHGGSGGGRPNRIMMCYDIRCVKCLDARNQCEECQPGWYVGNDFICVKSQSRGDSADRRPTTTAARVIVAVAAAVAAVSWCSGTFL